MRIDWRSHWLWFVVLLTCVSAADYIDHITRPDAPFRDRPLDWLGFTLGSHITLLTAAIGFAMVLRLLPVPRLLADTAGVTGAFALHLLVSGPFWNEMFWSEGVMTFDKLWIPMAAAALVYLLYRGVFAVLARGFARLSSR